MRRLIRRLRPDRNPLRRTADRIEAAVMAALLVAFLVGVPLAVFAAAGWVAADGMRIERAQARWRQVPAVLLRAAPDAAHALYQASQGPVVPARWTAPDGTVRVGEIYAPGGARAGTTVMVWTDGAGRLEGAPLQRADLAAHKTFAALLAAVLAASAVAVTGSVARWALDKRRLAAWDAEWSRTGPRWTGRV